MLPPCCRLVQNCPPSRWYSECTDGVSAIEARTTTTRYGSREPIDDLMLQDHPLIEPSGSTIRLIQDASEASIRAVPMCLASPGFTHHNDSTSCHPSPFSLSFAISKFPPGMPLSRSAKTRLPLIPREAFLSVWGSFDFDLQGEELRKVTSVMLKDVSWSSRVRNYRTDANQ
jgi:hypothetical protein